MALFPIVAESPRLRYEPLHPDRFDPLELYEHLKEGAPDIEETTRWVTWDPHRHPRETLEFLEDAGERFEEGEGVTFAISPREDEDGAGEFAGTCALRIDWERRRGTLGIWLRKPFWGRGYSGERARTIAALAFDVLDLGVVGVTRDPENDNSRRAIEKYVDSLGGHKEGTIRNDVLIGGEPRDSVRYSISAGEWRGATGGEYEASFEWSRE